MNWEVVIGMEVHVQPRTRTKMFCGCAIGQLGDPPNSNVCEVCMGMPGVLPVINKAAVEACLKTALALNCEIPKHTKFDRKNYMYPDLPKGYQISQYDLPMSVNGLLELDGRKVRIRRVHLEEDTGKLIHAGDKLHKAWESFVDLNRAGVPLMEIVSEPDIHTAEDATKYAQRLQELLREIGVAEADMEKGQLRAEPNISIRRYGTDDLGVKTELKNINSFRALHRSIDFEVKRQIEVVEAGGTVIQETRGWSEAEQRTFSQRSKEFAEDYRYFPEPDLPPLELDRAWIDELKGPVRKGLDRLRLKDEAVERLMREFALDHVASRQLVDAGLAALLVSSVEHGAGRTDTVNLLIQQVMPRLKGPWAGQLSPTQVSQLLGLVESRFLNRDYALRTLDAIWATNDEPESVAKANGWFGLVNDDVILNAIRATLQEDPRAAEDYRAGKQQAIGALVKAVLDACGGRADPKRVNQLLREALTRP